MGVAIDETGGQILAAQVDDLLRLVIITYPGDAASPDSDITRLNLPGEDVDDTGVGQDEVSRLPASCY